MEREGEERGESRTREDVLVGIQTILKHSRSMPQARAQLHHYDTYPSFVKLKRRLHNFKFSITFSDFPRFSFMSSAF